MIHLIKLSVGPKDVAQLASLQAQRLANDPPLRHQTRMMPKRGQELADGGSIYWVLSGHVLVRQRILEVQPDAWDDRTACAAIILDPKLVPVAPRPQKPFQGWRYLLPEAAPPDLPSYGAPGEGVGKLPPHLERELRILGLI